jgi:hypothetical protein
MSTLYEELKNHCEILGFDLFEVADLTSARIFVIRQGGEHIAAYPKAISLGI